LFVADAHITNESAASAFNIRFGIRVGGVYVPWKHSQLDAEPSRINVLRPNERHPEKVPIPIVLPDDLLLEIGRDRDPDEGRSYWAYYQGPAGDWWYTLNPSIPSDDLKITRVRSKRLAPVSPRNRQLDKALRLGVSVGFTGVTVSVGSRSDDERLARGD
jgi:hypothetical protein